MTNPRLANKVALVTGAARGIGLATVQLFAQEGATVIATDINLPSDLAEIDGVTWIQHDVTNLGEWEKIAADISRQHGRIDVLFNNAGAVGSYESLDTIPLEDWNKIVDLNLNGCFYAVRTVVPLMKEAGRGSIILTSSIWGTVGTAGVAAYTASKSAVRLLSKNAALSYAADNIRVNSIHPGIVDTPMISKQDGDVTAHIVGLTPLGRLGQPHELAYGALFLASDESSFMTGSELTIDGGYTAQ